MNSAFINREENMTRNPQYLSFLKFGVPEQIEESGEKGELRIWWTLVSFVVVYLVYVFERAIW